MRRNSPANKAEVLSTALSTIQVEVTYTGEASFGPGVGGGNARPGGGFGGGGAGLLSDEPSGGGGYSGGGGGGAGSWGDERYGGGGGSFISEEATLISAESGVNEGHGKVIITLIP